MKRSKEELLQKISTVDAWARQLARDDFEKAANIGALLSGAAAKYGPAIGRGLKTVANTGIGRRLAVGAGVGAAVNGVRHMLKPKNPMTGRRDGSFVGALGSGAAGGALAGAASKSLAEAALKTRPVNDLMHGSFSMPKQQA